MYATHLSAFVLTVTLLTVVVLAMGWALHMAPTRRAARRKPSAVPLSLPFVASTEGGHSAPGGRAGA